MTLHLSLTKLDTVVILGHEDDRRNQGWAGVRGSMNKAQV
jgi:hypothetical protein